MSKVEKKTPKYYWLKVEEGYFRDKRIKKMRLIAGGDTYTIIHLKMQLLSLKTGGILHYEGVEKTIEEELALELDEKTENVIATIGILKQLQLLVEVDEPSSLQFQNIQKLIVSEGASAQQMRELRDKKKQNSNNVTTMLPQCYNNVTTMLQEIEKEIDLEIEKEIDLEIEKEIDLEIEKEIEKEKNIVETKDVSNVHSKQKQFIINFLNAKSGKNFRTSTASTTKHINARLKEGFTVGDFMTVITKKCDEWLNSEMEQYLRPETLFGTKFESYLNQKTIKNPKGSTKTNVKNLNAWEEFLEDQEKEFGNIENA